MNADLCLHVSENVIASNRDRRAADAGFFARRNVQLFEFETFQLCPPGVHSQQHFSPVCRVGAAFAGLNLDVSTAGIFRLAHHRFQFDLFEVHLNAVDLSLNFGKILVRVVFLGELDENLQFLGTFHQRLQRLDGCIQSTEFRCRFLSAF